MHGSGVWAVVLAAGIARRAGSTKQLFELDGQPLVQHAIDNAAASRVDGTILVLGHEADRVRASIDPGKAVVVVNERYATGQASSLIAGIDALPTEAEAAVILLGDQPGVGAATIDRVIEAWHSSEKYLVLPSWNGERGNPVLIARPLFPEIRQLEGDTGARAIFRKHAGDIEIVEFDVPMPPDVDTAEDYAALRRDYER